MPIKFASNVTTRVSTVNLERQLLHILLLDKLNLQVSIGKHRSDFFTNQSRLFIYDCITRTFNEKRSTLTREQFDFEIQKRFDSAKDKSRIDDFTSEFDLISGTSVTEDIDVILQNLEDVQLANTTEALIREAYTKLESGNYTEAADVLKRKSITLGSVQREDRIYNLHKDSDEWLDEVKKRKEHPELYAGIKTGFKEFDEKTGGLFPAELTVVFGLSGKGKSTFMKAMACNIRKEGRVVLHCGNEENCFQIRSKYMSADSGFEYLPFKKGTYNDEDFVKLKKYTEKQRESKGEIYIYEFPQQTDATCIERAYRQLEMQGIHVDVIVVDYLDLMKPCQQAYSENDEGGKVTSDLKQVAINCNCPVVTATQAGIQSEKQEKKENPFLNQSDVFGTKRKVHSANVLIGIVNQTATAQAQDLTPEQRRIHHLVLCVPKNRDGAAFTFRQVMDTWTGMFYEDDGKSDNEEILKYIASQSLKMCDDTLLPGQMVKEISLDEIKKIKENKQKEEINKLKQQLENNESVRNGQKCTPDDDLSDDLSDDITDDDPFLGGTENDFENETSTEEDYETCTEEDYEDPFLDGIEEPVQEEPVQEEQAEENGNVQEDPLFGSSSFEGNDASASIEESKTVQEANPQSENSVQEPYGGADPLTCNEPLMPFDKPMSYYSGNSKDSANNSENRQEQQRTSESIPHKKTWAEIVAENKARKEALKKNG